jgi:isoleucyl-tRNA synthetase
VPFSTLIDPKTKKVSYLDNKKYWQKWYPADLVLECFPGQFKNWFYSMLAMSTILENKAPFTTLVGHGLVKDEKGEEMHKSKGNAIWFDEGVEKMGADVMRWIYSLQPHVLNLKFGYNVADKTRRRFHLVLWNVYKFFVLYANLEGWQPKKYKEKDLTALDKWILAKINVLTKKATDSLDKFDNTKAARSLENFVIDLSTWYVRRSRGRVGPLANKKDKETFLACFYYILQHLCLLLAPFVPFITEEIYTNLTQKKSVHLQSWPKAGAVSKASLTLLQEMKLVRQITEKGHSLRKEKGFKVRQPLAKLTVKGKEQVKFLRDSKFKKDLLDLLKEELNVKKIVLKETSSFSVLLDTKLTPVLKKEGEARELVRKIQQARKKAGLTMNKKITVYLPAWPKEFENEIKSKAMLKQLKRGSSFKLEA